MEDIDMSFVENVIPLAIVVMGVCAPLAVVILRVVVDYRKKREIFQLHHAERMAAIEKGIDVPPLPREFFTDHRFRSPGRFLHRGLVWTLVGVAVTAALWETHSEDFRPMWGLVPVAYGLGNLLFHFVARRTKVLDSGSDSTRPV
jgi:hypothetical protein